MSVSGWAKNTTTTVEQVTESVQVTGETDYVITGETPFGAMGSVDIQDVEHSTVIIQTMRPSKVIASLMGNIYIAGVKAVDGENCQVRMYNRGAIILPYSKSIKPLTCYTEEGYEGTAYDGYTEGSSGGFMKTLNANQLNNQIKSFKLKRGYMVTFAVGQGGWGYSRCFIADQEDLEISKVPAPLNGKISSYRIFKWWNASKAGVHHTGKEANEALRTTSCFDWAQGNASLLPDVEWVPNHIYEDWPSASTCGSVTGSCHMKTNNEPGNSADDHPQDVETVLNNWQNLMRTGMRLCSESSHDGSMNHLKTFIDEIDKRGWRCDILDLHCYWDSGTFNSLTWYSDYYGNGRPIWISEWVWGASWNHNGAFADGRQSEEATYNGTKGIIDVLNSNSRVERYFYWNSEAWYTKIVRDDGSLTKLGKYFASTETGLAYNPQNEYIPKVVYAAPSALEGSFDTKTQKVTLMWTDANGDMIDSIRVERKAPNTTKWVKVEGIEPKDQTSKEGASYSYTATETESGLSYYRVVEYYNGGKKFTSDDYGVTVSAATSVGDLQYGQLKLSSAESVTTDIIEQPANPIVVTGLVSNKNTANGITNQVQTITKKSFKFRLYPWNLSTPVSITSAETVDYMVLPADTIWQLGDEMMLISQKVGNVKGDEVSVTFPKAFPVGVTPVVVAQQNSSIASYKPVTVRVSDVTNEGFKVKLVAQEGEKISAENVNYFACTPGQVKVGRGKLLTVGRNNETPVGGITRQTVVFKDAEGNQLSLIDPIMVVAPQTNNYEVTSIIRQHSTTKDDNGGIYQGSFKRQTDPVTTVKTKNDAKENGDYLGWIILSTDPNGTGDEEPLIISEAERTGITNTFVREGFSVSASDGIITADGKNVRAFNAAGQEVSLGKKVPAGIYVITNGKKSIKIRVK